MSKPWSQIPRGATVVRSNHSKPFFARRFSRLHTSLNVAWFADKLQPVTFSKNIFHFVGETKLWHPFGKFIHRGYKTWSSHVSKTSRRKDTTSNFAKTKIVWNLGRGYVRLVLTLLKSRLLKQKSI